MKTKSPVIEKSEIQEAEIIELEELNEFESEVEENSAETDSDKPKRSRIPYYVTSVVVVIALISGIGWWLYSKRFEKTDDAYIQGNISLISPKIGSNVEKIYVKENQFVKKGDLLIEFDDREARINLEKAKAELNRVLAQKNKTVADYDLTRKVSKADLNQASSNLNSAKNTAEQVGIASGSKLNSIEQAKNQKRIVEATVRQVQSQIAAAQAAVEQRKAQIPAAKIKLDNAQAELERSEKLFNSGVVSRQDLEREKRNVSEAQANLVTVQKQADISEAELNSLIRQVDVEKLRVNEAENKITAAENDYRQSISEKNAASSQVGESAGRMEKANVIPEQLAIGSSEIQTADSEIAQAQVAVEQAELQLSYTKIYAPQDGYVSRRSVVEGQLVQPDQNLMAISLPGIWVAANYKETQIGRIRPGQRVQIYVDAYPSRSFSGKVDSVQAATGSRFSILPSENSSGNYVKVVQRIPVKIVFDPMPDENILLAPGMSVVSKIVVD